MSVLAALLLTGGMLMTPARAAEPEVIWTHRPVPFEGSPVAFSPDDRFLLFSKREKTGDNRDLETDTLIDLTTETAVSTIDKRADAFFSGAVFSPDATVLAGRYYNYLPPQENPDGVSAHLTFYRVSTGKPLFTPKLSYRENSSPVAAFAPDSKTVATGLRAPSKERGSRQISLYDTSSGAELWYADTESGVYPGAFTPDGRVLVCNGYDRVETRSAADGHLLNAFGVVPAGEELLHLALSPNGETAAALTQGAGKTFLRLWRTSDGQTLHHFSLPDTFGKVHDPRLTYSPDGSVVAVHQDADGAWAIRRVADGQPLPSLEGVRGITAFTGDGQSLISIDGNQVRSIRLSDGGTRYATPLDHVAANHPDRATILSPNGTRLAVLQNYAIYSPPWLPPRNASSSPPTFDLYDLATGNHIRRFNPMGARLFSPDGSLLASPTALYRAEDGRLHRELERTNYHYGLTSINGMEFSPDGTRLVQVWGGSDESCYKGMCEGGGENKILGWNTATGALTREIYANGIPASLDLSPDGQLLAVGHGRYNSRQISGSGPVDFVIGDYNVRIFAANSGELSQVWKGHTERVRLVRFSPDGQTLASVSEKGVLHFWRVSDGTLLRTLQVPADFRDADFTPDGSALVVTTANGAEWRSVGTGQMLQRLTGDFIAQDRVYLISRTGDGVTFYRSKDGTAVQSYTANVARLILSPDHLKFAYERGDGSFTLARFSENPALVTPPARGDVTADGAVDIQDAVKTLRYLVGLETPTPRERASADVNGDGVIDLTDAILILQVLAGLRLDFDPHPPLSDAFTPSPAPFWKLKQVRVGESPAPYTPAWNVQEGKLNLTFAGEDVWEGAWEPGFLYQEGIYGDFTMQVKVEGVPALSDLSAVGLMVAQSVPDRLLTPATIPTWGAVMATANYGAEAKWGGMGRSETSFPGTVDAALKPPYWLRLDRQGQTLSFHTSTDGGKTWAPVGEPVNLSARGWSLRDSLAAGVVVQTHQGRMEGTGIVSSFQAGVLSLAGKLPGDAAP